jgi:hypothetical protein
MSSSCLTRLSLLSETWVKEMEHPRYGVQYTNPELLKQLAAPTQEEIEANLDGMILDACFQAHNDHWTGYSMGDG